MISEQLNTLSQCQQRLLHEVLRLIANHVSDLEDQRKISHTSDDNSLDKLVHLIYICYNNSLDEQNLMTFVWLMSVFSLKLKYLEDKPTNADKYAEFARDAIPRCLEILKYSSSLNL